MALSGFKPSPPKQKIATGAIWLLKPPGKNRCKQILKSNLWAKPRRHVSSRIFETLRKVQVKNVESQWQEMLLVEGVKVKQTFLDFLLAGRCFVWVRVANENASSRSHTSGCSLPFFTTHERATRVELPHAVITRQSIQPAVTTNQS